MTIGNVALRLPPSVMDDVKVPTAPDPVSGNPFPVQAAAENVASLNACGDLAERAAQAMTGDMGRAPAKAGAAVARAAEQWTTWTR
ncbi:MAG: hypothetical protein ACREFY_10885 [Acetobacteraceae bacterium]